MESNTIACAFKLIYGDYLPAVLVRDYGKNYSAFVYETEKALTKEQAERIARKTLKDLNKIYFSEQWGNYTNASGTLEYLKEEGFTL